MKFRSWLIVPGNSDEDLGAAFGSGADAIVVDLEESVSHDQKPRARQMGAEWLAAHRTNLLEHRQMSRWVRINALDSGHAREDLAAVMPEAPDGIILPKAAGPEAVRQLASEIYEFEQRIALPANSTRIMSVVGETPLSAMRIAEYIGTAHQRLCALTWNAGGLTASLGGTGVRRADGTWSDACSFVRAQTLLTAHAGMFAAIDTGFDDRKDAAGLANAARQARRDGFAGMFALHPDQVAAINEAFMPSGDEVEDARAIMDAFASSPHAETLPFKGRMVDRAHLAIAERTVELAAYATAGGDTRTGPILRPA
ncbi:HpcH/HpaI aldolase/citrate lyase family protein [Novosphingobium malaysiense]|uniref:HpcH/HpaI aldolase/citrate lyase family protein n=1 Tax=Novosphingobium malaysiense TaxID=1348853 RepID=UPI00068EAE8E|nr:CoA ester lyase [Novosphingobium malaysiense]